MSESTVSLIILAAVLFLFIWGKIPIGVTAILGAVAMAACGIISYSKAFSFFGQDTTVMMVIGMITIGNAMFESGCAKAIGRSITRLKGIGSNEQAFLLVVLVLVTALSAFTSNTATVALFFPLISSVAAESGGAITRKNTFMAVGVASLIGGNMTLVGSTPQLVAQGVLESTGNETLGFFTLLAGATPSFLVMLLYYTTFGYRLQKRIFRFAETYETDSQGGDTGTDKRKMWLCACIFIGVVICFMLNIASYGTVAIVGACLCIITGCISIQKAFSMMDWMAVMVLGGCLGFAEGLKQSGAIELVAEKSLALMGGAATSPWVVAAGIAIISSLLGNVMSHTATAAIMTPFAIAMANSVNARPLTFVIIVIISCNLCFATPMSTPPMTMTLTAGYRFKDYTIAGGIFNLLALGVTILFVPLIYGL